MLFLGGLLTGSLFGVSVMCFMQVAKCDDCQNNKENKK